MVEENAIALKWTLKTHIDFFPNSILYTRVTQKYMRVDTYLLNKPMYDSQNWHIYSMNHPASEYEKNMIMQNIGCCC